MFANCRWRNGNKAILALAVGYDKAAKIAKVAMEQNKTIRQVAEEMSGLDKAKLNELLDPSKQCEPGGVEMAGSGG